MLRGEAIIKFLKKVAYYWMSLKARKSGIKLGRNVGVLASGKYSVHKSGHIELADNVYICANHSLTADIGADIFLGEGVFLKEGVRLHAGPGARIFVDKGCFMNHDVSIVALKEIRIGKNTIIGPYSYLSDHNHETAKERLISSQGYDLEPVVVGSDVWLGVGATLLKGSTVGDGAVIAARAVVNKSVPDYEIWGGIPAKRIGERT